MPDTISTDQLPPSTTTTTTTTNNRGSRKWATLGGRGSSSTRIPANDSDVNTQPHRSISLFRKASTISRTNEAAAAAGQADENSSASLKKSRSLMNVLRSKLNSPAVLRRFRSKSRESTKQTVTDVNGHTTNEQQPEPKQSNDEQVSMRKSRKREPSPMRRLANRITQFTRHSRGTSIDREKKSPSKSITNDSHDEVQKTSSSPSHNKDEVDHINACYDEIRAKYYTNKQSSSNNDTKTSQQINLPFLSNDDPVFQARKQANIKLNCMLSGYSLTRSFANHEKLCGENNLFKFNHYYDVGKRKYDWNSTNNNNSQTFSNAKTRPISKSIDSFRHTTMTNDNQVPVKFDQINIVDNEPLVQTETHQEINNNELFITEDNDLIESKGNIDEIQVPDVPVVNDKQDTVDEEFERNFLRAVDRALGVVNKSDENDDNDNIEKEQEKEKDESPLNLIEMTERALSSFNNLPIFSNDNEKTDENVVENEEKSPDDTQLLTTEVIDHPKESLINEELPKVDLEKQIEVPPPTADDVIDENIISVINDLTQKVEESLLDQPKVSSVND